MKIRLHITSITHLGFVINAYKKYFVAIKYFFPFTLQSNIRKIILDLAYEKTILNGQDLDKIEILLNAIVYGKSNTTEYKELYLKKVSLPSKSLYERLAEKINQGYQIKEYLGVYYQNDSPNVPEANKIEKKVITYEITK